MSRAIEREELRTFWQGHLEKWSESGESQSTYCRTNDLAIHQFIYWKRKLLGKPHPRKTSSGFVQVCQGEVESGLSVTLENGLIIHGIDQNNLAVVIQLLRQL